MARIVNPEAVCQMSCEASRSFKTVRFSWWAQKVFEA